MGINSCHYQPINFKFGRTSVIDNYRQSMRGNKFSFNKVDSDTFVSTASEKTFEMGELERLFPNGEINKIYNNIVKEYGLEKPPKLKLISNSNSDDYASSFQISNAIDLNLDNLVSKNMYKFKIKQAGKEFYSYDNDQNRIVIIKTDDKSVINSITEYNKSLGADECFAEHLTDDDKRKLIIFTLAHELEHCYQYQIIRHTEGLDNFKMIETHLLNYPNKPKLNMIDEKVLLYELRKQYFSNFSGEDFDKIYSKTSEEGQKAIEWYNAGVYYTDYKSDYNKYKLNPLELDANNRAHQYLTTHYGELDGLVENVLQ